MLKMMKGSAALTDEYLTYVSTEYGYKYYFKRLIEFLDNYGFIFKLNVELYFHELAKSVNNWQNKQKIENYINLDHKKLLIKYSQAMIDYANFLF